MATKAKREMIINDIMCLMSAHTEPKEIFDKNGQNWHVSYRTFYRYVQEASGRLSAQQKTIQNELMVKIASHTKQRLKMALMTKEDALRKLQDIAMNGKRDSDKINAIKTMMEMEGWKASVKSDVNLIGITPVFGFNPLIDNI
ncbi:MULTISPECIES: hypothetical protein [Flavobacterium]|uniref:hypothetical protein n=1 Tax=Flavobacterium TaxID=237 RepID=UPI001FCCB629|nr:MULTISPECIES: hypothetical protein [Flavobacterium]UOK41588.1 hypothetical protein LZF87_09725 [Flavobacterium enshiense]